MGDYRFLNADVYTMKINYPEYLVGDRDLIVNNAPFQPNEERLCSIRLVRYDRYLDQRPFLDRWFGEGGKIDGVMLFYSPSGNLMVVKIAGKIVDVGKVELAVEDVPPCAPQYVVSEEKADTGH